MKLHELTDTKRMCDNLQYVLARCLNQVDERRVFGIEWSKKHRKFRVTFATKTGRKYSAYYTSKEILNPVTCMLSDMLKKVKGNKIKQHTLREYYYGLNKSAVIPDINDEDLPF